MRIIGCDLHARQQTVAMLDTTTGEVVKMTLTHEGDNVREFYSSLTRRMPDRSSGRDSGGAPEESLRARFSQIEYSQPAVRTPTGASPSPFATSSWNSSNQL